MAPGSSSTPPPSSKRARSASPDSSEPVPPSRSASSSPDPDGRPALLREMVEKKPQILASIEKLMLSSMAKQGARRAIVVGSTADSSLVVGSGSSAFSVPQTPARGSLSAVAVPVGAAPGSGSARDAPSGIAGVDKGKGVVMHLTALHQGIPVGIGGSLMAPRVAVAGVTRSRGSPAPGAVLPDEAKPMLSPSIRIQAALKGKGIDYAWAARNGSVPNFAGAVKAEEGSGARVALNSSLSARSAADLMPPPTRPTPVRIRRIERQMIRPPMEPLNLHRGGSFVKHFTSPFKQSIEIPALFWVRIPDREDNTIVLFGEGPRGTVVTVEQRNGKYYFTKGWSDFVESERIGRYDTAVFAWIISNYVGMRLYGPNGVENPMEFRPPVDHPMLQDFANPAAALNANGPNVDVPANILDMVYEIGAGVTMDGLVMQTMANVWHNLESHFPLYVCKITSSHVGERAQFFFSSGFSRYLRIGTPATLHLGPAPFGYQSLLVRYEGSDTARLVTRWNHFAAWCRFEVGSTQVVSVVETPAGSYEIRFFDAGAGDA